MRTVFLALLLVAPAWVIAVPVGAQAGVVETSVQVILEDPGRALVPGRNETIPLRIVYSWDAGARPAPAENLSHPRPTKVSLRVVQAPSWVVDAHVYPSEVYVEFPPTMAPISGNQAVATVMSVNLTVEEGAPALQREDVFVEAVAEPNGNMAGATGQNTGLKVRAKVVAALNVTPPQDVVIPGGRWATVPFVVTNEGNYPVNATVELVTKPENSETRVPEIVELARGESKVVEVEIRMPWTEGEVGTLALAATPILEEEEGKPTSAEVDVTGMSAVPLPSLGMLLAGLFGAALARSRRAA